MPEASLKLLQKPCLSAVQYERRTRIRSGKSMHAQAGCMLCGVPGPDAEAMPRDTEMLYVQSRSTKSSKRLRRRFNTPTHIPPASGLYLISSKPVCMHDGVSTPIAPANFKAKLFCIAAS